MTETTKTTETYTQVKKQVKGDFPKKDRYKSICARINEGKQAVCKNCKGTYFNVIKKPDLAMKGKLCFLDLYCPKCELTYCIATVDPSLVGGDSS